MRSLPSGKDYKNCTKNYKEMSCTSKKFIFPLIALIFAELKDYLRLSAKSAGEKVCIGQL